MLQDIINGLNEGWIYTSDYDGYTVNLHIRHSVIEDVPSECMVKVDESGALYEPSVEDTANIIYNVLQDRNEWEVLM